MGSNGMARGFLGLRFRDVVVGFLLACISWFVLTALWTVATPGGAYDKIVGGIFAIPYRAGKHLTHVVLPNTSIRNATAYYIAPVVGICAEILLLMIIWMAIMAIMRLAKSFRNDGQIRRL